ncbi:hypothetical protein Ancab_024854 [Ancistrocladus abbreviatus]
MDNYLLVGNRGQSGGLALFWNDTADIKAVIQIDQLLLYKVHPNDVQNCWWLAGVYHAPNFPNKMIVWDALEVFLQATTNPVVLIGYRHLGLSNDGYLQLALLTANYSTGYGSFVLRDLQFQFKSSEIIYYTIGNPLVLEAQTMLSTMQYAKHRQLWKDPKWRSTSEIKENMEFMILPEISYCHFKA